MTKNYKIEIKFNHFPELAIKAHREVSEIVRLAAHEVEAISKNSMTGQGKGRWYGTHQASAPGDPPAVDTGALKNSINVDMEGDLTAIIGPHVEYAAYLEFGTIHMEARPFMTPAAEEVKPKYIAALTQLEDRLR